MQRVGVDLVEVRRIRRTLGRFGPRFLERVYTPLERERYADRVQSLAARWAAKEAVSKALGRGLGDFRWREIEVVNDPMGAPVLRLYGEMQAYASALGLTEWAISLSHTEDYAIAVVMAS
jgi:holo-[acyl-carrier protein] synthase